MNTPLTWWIQLKYSFWLTENLQLRTFPNNWVCLLISQTVHDDFAFSKVNCHWVSPGQCNASYGCKNSGNHQSVLLGTAAASSLKTRSGPLWFPLVWLPQRISAQNNVFKWKWNEEHHEQMAKKSVQRFLYWRNTKQKIVFQREKCILKNGDCIKK